MNRSPKYRAWHKIEERFVDLRSIDFESETIGYDAMGEANYYEAEPFENIVFQQYIGMKDMKGIEIYEGDILASDDTEIGGEKTIGDVVYCPDLTLMQSPGFVLWVHKTLTPIPEGMSGVGLQFSFPFCNEVIGNVFENKELLK